MVLSSNYSRVNFERVMIHWKGPTQKNLIGMKKKKNKIIIIVHRRRQEHKQAAFILSPLHDAFFEKKK